jgi:hypothetical protein
MYKPNIEARSHAHCCRGNAITITYSKCCVCSLSYLASKVHAPYYIVFVVCLALPYFSALRHKRHDFREKIY